MDAILSHFQAFAHVEAWVALLTLSVMEVVLGLDNVIFIAILVGKLPAHERERTRRLGLIIALVLRISLLLTISWLMGLKESLFTFPGTTWSPTGKDLILLGGGLFLIYKSAKEIYEKVELHEGHQEASEPKSRAGMLMQIVIIDIVFSLDSIITAVGMAKDIIVMIFAMFIAMGVMLKSAGAIGDFIDRHPGMKILALAFLLLIGVMLTAESFGQHVEKGYIYFAMAFAVSIQLLDMRMKGKKIT